MKSIELSVHPSIPVSLNVGGEENLTLEMREMSAASRDKWLNNFSDRMRLDKEGRPCGIKNYVGLQADMLALCLFRPDGKTVTKEEVQTWPSSIVAQLFKSAQELNSLEGEEVAVEQAKND